MQALFISAGLVALAEMGDKTQLLAVVLAAKFRRPVPIILGILAATLANHALAGILGTWMPALLAPEVLRWVLGISFLSMALWTLVPDRLDEAEARLPHYSVFFTTLVSFFLAEVGDKTQIATMALAARFHSFFAVVGGTVLGMMLADVPAVLIGHRIAARIPLRLVHGIAAALFALLGIATLFGAGERWGF